ncbi:MAG: zf-HC2 domain-containing protein, partial [Defluviitaleaceae bacterium]|nr:zf-HC2 domain-containing protein [Defluviitaleaceae bacterium]
MFKCEDMDLFVSLYIDNELTKSEKETFEKHIESCENCKIYFEEYKQLFTEVKNIEEHEFPENLHIEIMNKIRLERHKNVSFRRFVPLVASVVIMFLLVSTIMNSTGDSDNAEVANDFAPLATTAWEADTSPVPALASRIAFDTLDEDFSQEDSLEEFGTVEVSDFEDAELEELRVAY